MVAAGAETASTNVLLLDTNILIIYAREGLPGRKLEAMLNLQSGKVEGLVSVVCIGEALALAKKLNWGGKRQEKLRELLHTRVVSVDINRDEILEAYAKIDHYTEHVQTPARPMGKNDLWIAATAHVLGCELVTTDKDFDHLNGIMLRRRLIDQTSLKAE